MAWCRDLEFPFCPSFLVKLKMAQVSPETHSLIDALGGVGVMGRKLDKEGKRKCQLALSGSIQLAQLIICGSCV